MPFGTSLGGDDFTPGYTAIEPGDTRSFAERMKAAMTLPQPQFDELVAAAAEETRLTRLTSSRTEAMADAADQRIRTVQEQTGVQLENPFRQGYLMEANRRYDDARARGQDLGPRALAVRQLQRDIFTENVDGAAQKFPDKAGALSFFQPIEDQARAIATSAEDRAAAARAAFSKAGGWGADTFFAEVAGGLYGARRDPLQVASLAIGPTGAAGRAILGRVLAAGGTQGLVNVGLLALEKPEANAWRQQRGLSDQSNLPSLAETGWAFTLGFIPGAGIQGAIEAKSLAALRRVMAGEGTAADMPAALRALGVHSDQDLADALAAGQREIDADAAAIAEKPAGAPAPMAEDAAGQALRHALDPANEPRAPHLPQVAEGVVDDPAAAAMRAHADPLDGVEALRADRSLIDSALSSASPDLQMAGRLASLSDEAFAMVRDGADPRFAAIVAEHTPLPEWHADVLDMVIRAKPIDARDARMIASDTVEALIDREATAKESLRQTLAADDAAARLGAATRQIDGVTIRLPDADHAKLFDIGAQFSRGEKVPAEKLQAAFDRFKGYVVEDVAYNERFASPADVEIYARRYYDDAAEQAKLHGGEIDAGDMLDPDFREAWQRRQIDEMRKDVLDMRIIVNADGSAELVSRDAAQSVGQREIYLADLIGACKT